MIKTLIFDEKTHSYELSDGTKLIGVNELLSLFQNPFYAESIARNMAKEQGRDYKEIMAEWKQSAEFGTKMHNFASSVINGEDLSKFDYNTKNMAYFNTILIWLYQNKKVNPKSEIKLFNEDFRIAGTIDLINGFDIYDWKTNKNIDSNGYNKKMKFFSYIDDSTFNKYCFQLSMYKILAKLNEFPINKTYLLHVQEFKITEMECIDYTDECEFILKLWKKSDFNKDKLKELIK